MPGISDIQVRARLAEVVDLIGRHEVALAYLKQEHGELEIAVRVMDRFYERQSFGELLPPDRAAPEPDTGKPAGVPTVPHMIAEVLSLRALLDGPGAALAPKEILAEIRRLWWPDARTNDVSPILWRLAKEGRLAKTGKTYSLPKEETPAVQPAGASERRPLSEGLFDHPPRDTGETERG
jgi:hypothetical protein